MTGTPYPAPLEFDLDTRALQHQGAPVARVYDDGDFPCADEDQIEKIGADLDATGRRLALAYNRQDEILEWLSRFVKASEYVADDTGILRRYREEAGELMGKIAADQLGLPDGASTS